MKWISVKERLPDLLDEVLLNVATPDGPIILLGCRREGALPEQRAKQVSYFVFWNKYGQGSIEPKSDTSVTHWMPLPEPPTP